ncbi:hypothetical protein BC830DRAFT_680747 [Chytriomyces sp. MP71]|nr:hypothetical protein BC830DRAFT_680747 [Chytriomyces sp. MP71]
MRVTHNTSGSVMGQLERVPFTQRAAAAALGFGGPAGGGGAGAGVPAGAAGAGGAGGAVAGNGTAGNGNGANGANAQVVSITAHSYDKRGLLSRDTDAFALSLRSLSYLSLANTHQLSALMLADGGVSLLVHVLSSLLLQSHPQQLQQQQQLPLQSSEYPPLASVALDKDDRTALASHALSTATNLMVRGRSKVRDALVEAGIVSVLVAFLDPIVEAIEALQLLSSQAPPLEHLVTVAAAPTHPASMGHPADAELSLNHASATSSSDSMDIDSSEVLQTVSTASASNSNAASMDSIPSVLSTAEPNTPAHFAVQSSIMDDTSRSTIIPLRTARQEQNQEQQATDAGVINNILPHAPSAAEPQPPQQLPTPNPQQQQQEPASLQNTHGQHHHHHHHKSSQDMPLLPGVRLPLPQTPETSAHLQKVIPHQHHILMAAKMLHVVSKYPHLRHYMHVDSTRPVRAAVRDLCAAAIAAADGVAGDRPDVSGVTGCGGSADEAVIAEAKVISSSATDGAPPVRARILLDRFEGVSPSATPPPSVQQHAATAAAASTVIPVVTTIPMLVFAHESPDELELLERLCVPPPATIPSLPLSPSSSTSSSTSTSPAAALQQRNHLISTTLHYLPAPANPRSAFELLETFTAPCSLIPDARALAVATLRNAYRRDPVPGPAEPPHAPLNQAMGPCVYVDVDTFAGGKGRVVAGGVCGVGSGGKGRSVVVGLGHLRRCASSRCGKWEEGYKQFSKCSRCRRVSYCSKHCQRRAWVLHKNWCLKYTGETAASSASMAMASAAVPSAAMVTPTQGEDAPAAAGRRRASSGAVGVDQGAVEQ